MLGLYLRTARYYRPSQIAARLRLGVDSLLVRKSPWLRQHRYAVPAAPPTNDRATFFRTEHAGYDHPTFNHEAERWSETARLCAQGTFKLLNRAVNLGSPINWRAPGTTRLWRYNLHYFDYALDLAQFAKWRNDEQAAAQLERLFSDWIEANPLGEGVGWHSYPVARRIVNWIQAVSLGSSEFVFSRAEAQTAWLKSLYQQALYLEDRLEFDCLGNHLLADAKALVFAGIFFNDEAAARWLGMGEQLLWSGLREQILEDGGHYERSPMYHAIVLQDYLEIALAFQLNGRELPAWARERLLSMGDFLSGITHPDGEIPLFGDSAFGIAHSPTDILAVAEILLDQEGRWPAAKPVEYCGLLTPQGFKIRVIRSTSQTKCDSWRATGYFVLRGSAQGDQMIIDAKPMGPDHIPAHGHCSLFSYELSVAGERLVVDSGVDEYESGRWRQFWRSTRAHNTLVVDGCEQSEIWASFRVGRRSRVLDATCLQEDSSVLFVGAHDGFARQTIPVLHRRFIAALTGRVWLVLDEVTGSGQHTIESFVHLHPEAACEVRDTHAEIVLRSIRVRFYPYASTRHGATKMACVRGQEEPIQGWYAPEFGKREANSVLSFSCDTALPVRVGYVIAPSDYEISSWEVEYSDIGDTVQTDVFVRSPRGDIAKRFQRAKPNSDSFATLH
jgi:uncharacterized heparinase superfamily protein